MIHALVLAAGESTRMGMPKPLLRFEATTFLQQIITVLQRSHVDQMTVVLGAEAERIRSSTDLSRVGTVVNHDYHRGQLSSLAVGLRSLPRETDAIVLCLADNPFITPTLVNCIVRVFRETGTPIVVPAYDGHRGHPTLFAQSVFDDLLDAPPDQGARYVVRAIAHRVLELPLADLAILTRINTPDDYFATFGTSAQTVDRK